jgi:hypothetical protein
MRPATERAKTMRFSCLTLSTLLAAAQATQAVACAFHNYAPGNSLVDRLLASDHIILARPDPDDPGAYRAVSALEGGIADVVIPEPLDPGTRARLLANPGDSVLFARDEAYGPWMRLAYLDPAFGAVIDEVMTRLPQWELGDDLGRFAMFAPLVDHPDPEIAATALREVDQADYSVLRQLPLPRDAGPVLARIDQPDEGDLRPIRILLLGLSGDPRAEAYLRPAFGRALQSDGAVLGAYATALLEAGGPAAAKEMAREVLLDADLSVETRELVVEAFALHSQSGAEETGAAARAAIEAALSEAPELAGPVARQFGMRGDFRLSAPLAEMMNARKVTVVTDMLSVGQYVMFAREGN